MFRFNQARVFGICGSNGAVLGLITSKMVAGSGFGEKLFSDHRTIRPSDETVGVGNAVSCYKEAVFD